MTRSYLLWLCGGGLVAATAAWQTAPHVEAALAPGAGMAKAANSFLAALTPEQRAKATFKLDDAHRVEWFYVPIARKGVPLKQLTQEQRQRAMALLQSGLSPAGYTKTSQIIELEKVLAELEKNPVKRDPELYYVSIFGTPSPAGTWGWRMEGHHVSLNYTIVNDTMFATSPVFMGANPGEVREGALKGRRVLRLEEDLGRELALSFTGKLRAKLIFNSTAPAEVLTTNLPKVDPLEPVGVSVPEMLPAQVALLRKLLNEYAAAMPAELAKQRLARLETAGFDKIRFGWAGGLERGVGHYYRIQGPTFLVEYDNTQNDANHVHVVWRDFDGDFGRDLLREHLKGSHGPAASATK